MLLETIESPADLKALSPEQLEQLAEEMRAHIIGAVNEHGGHLGSNLGVIELTLAIHRVFDSPDDIILWDTGHQSYPHKLVTGRAQGFAQLRQAGGLSGYPSRAESEHDWIENSHASTVLSWAYGLSVAESTSDRPHRRIVAVIGDGAMTGGMAFEGLNNLGHAGRDCIIILNDNGRSYAPTVSRLGESLVKIRNNPVYMRRQAKLEKLLAELPVVGNLAKSGLDATKAAIREMWEPTAFFEALGVRYAGPFDGHDIGAVEEALRNAAAMPGGPLVVHVLTQKGRGYGPAENDPIKRLHDTSEAKPGSFTAAFTEAMLKEGENRPELFAITAAMPDSTGLLPFAERFPGRMIDVGIAEQHAVTSAAGMAMGGLRPVVAVYSTFLTRAFDQVNLDVGLHGQPVVFCLDRAGITGDDGPSHHGVLDMVLLTKVPNMTVLAPSSYQEIGQMLHDALEMRDGPVAIRWAKTAARHVGPDEVGSGLRARRLRQGTDVCILSVGKMLDAAEAAADALCDEGVSVSLWDVRCCKPLDTEMLDAASGHRIVVTVEDGLREGGVGMTIADRLASGTDGAPLVRVLGVPDRYVPHGKPDAIMADLGLDASGIAATVRSLLGVATNGA